MMFGLGQIKTNQSPVGTSVAKKALNNLRNPSKDSRWKQPHPFAYIPSVWFTVLVVVDAYLFSQYFIAREYIIYRNKIC